MPVQSQVQREQNWEVARQKTLAIYKDWLKKHRSLCGSATNMGSSNDVMTSIDMPIALRKGKRRSSVLVSPKKSQPDICRIDKNFPPAVTPSGRSKRVRFSDSYVPLDTAPISTGITPHLRRASLGTPKSRRNPTPARSEVSYDLMFTPIKQVLDDRVKRRIRRNGLSDEMNQYEAEKKTNADLQRQIEAKDAELKRLQCELEEARSRPAQNETPPADAPASQERVDQVEAELEALRQSFALEQSQPVQSWDHVPRGTSGPRSVGGDTILIYEDEDEDVRHDCGDIAMDSDSLAMGLELEAARQAKQSILGSFRDSLSFGGSAIDFADSPARRKSQDVGPSPKTPRTFYHDLSRQLKATTNRAEDAELALKTLEHEVMDLGFIGNQHDASGAITAILDHFRQARMDLERILPGETVIGFENAKVLPELIVKLKVFAQQLKTKESELKAARDQHHNLKGNFEKAIVAAEKANARIKDLETAIDTQAEDMLGVRIRAQNLEKDLIAKEKDVESLTAALNKYREDISRLESLIITLEQEHETKLSDSVSEHKQNISDLDAKVAAETTGRRAAEHSAVSRLAKINELELTLSTNRQHMADLESQISTLQSQLSSDTTTHDQELGSLNSRISNLSTALTHANAEVSKLRAIKFRLEDRLRDEVETGARAVEAIQADLIRSVAKTNEDKKKYIRGAKVRIANWEMELDDNSGEDASSSVAGPMTPSSLVRFADLAEEIEFTAGAGLYHRQRSSGDDDDEDARSDHVPGSVDVGRGRLRRSLSSDMLRHPRGLSIGMGKSHRRRYDSGIGMSPVSESDLQAAFEEDDREQSHGLITPDLSSEGDELERGREYQSVEAMDA